MSNNNAMILAGLIEWINSTSKILTSGAIICGLLWFISKPWIDPYLQLPDKVLVLSGGITDFKLKLAKRPPKQFVEFLGDPITVSQSLDRITLLYFLRGNIHCKNRLYSRFWNVEKGYFEPATGERILTLPLTTDFIPVKISIVLPNNLPSGIYSYIPILYSYGCVAKVSVVVPASTPFEAHTPLM